MHPIADLHPPQVPPAHPRTLDPVQYQARERHKGTQRKSRRRSPHGRREDGLGRRRHRHRQVRGEEGPGNGHNSYGYDGHGYGSRCRARQLDTPPGGRMSATLACVCASREIISRDWQVGGLVAAGMGMGKPNGTRDGLVYNPVHWMDGDRRVNGWREVWICEEGFFWLACWLVCIFAFLHFRIRNSA